MIVIKQKTEKLAFLLLVAFAAAASANWTAPLPVTEINTEFIERTPFLSADGRTLYFAREATGTFYFARIYQATRSGPSGPFTSVEEISQLNYLDGHVSAPWVSTDNLRMYYTRTEPGAVSYLRFTQRNSVNDPWSSGSNISELDALGSVNWITLTADERTAFFMSDNIPGGAGAQDLWTCSRQDRNSPFDVNTLQNLSELNTDANEYSSCILPDGLMIYFTSNRNGTYQLFSATRQSIEEPFGDVTHLSFFDEPGLEIYSVHVAGYESNEAALYFTYGSNTVPHDIYVSYSYMPTGVFYVDALNGSDSHDGLTWQTAFATIQKGIDSAQNGNTVLVYPGVYNEEVDYKAKALTVKSTGQNAPIIQAPGDFAVSFYSGEGHNSVLQNFVLRNSYMAVFIAGSSPTLKNLTIVDNDFGIAAYASADPNITSCIFYNNIEGDLFQCLAQYSWFQDHNEPNNTPLFADPNNDDYHLLSQKGRYVSAHGLWAFDTVTSPCIDRGDPLQDPSNEPMPNGGRINAGAYGNTPYASMSEWPLLADINHDGAVDMVDLTILAEDWLLAMPWAQ
ncbi:MAG: hypothetical protein ABIG61_08650 [Planctomycetota bacterium]